MASQSDLDTLEAAIFSGTKRVEYSNGNKVEYQSLSDMLRARDLLKKELGLRSGRFTRIKAEFSKTGEDYDCEDDE